MKRDQLLAILSAHRDDLRLRYGVSSIAIFGSVARDEAGPGSDVDLLVEFDRPIGLRFFELNDHLEELLGCRVDLGTPQSLKPRLRERVLAEAVNLPT
jgi:hypothetical protein